MLSAMTDKLPEEKEWEKIYYANIFLKRMLKVKMERLMVEHSKVELAFHHMKQETSLRDANELIDRFLNKEQYYGQLLESISEKEERLEALKEEREQVEKEYQETLYKNEEMDEEKIKSNNSISEH